ncbi:hypothetical protein IJJ18_01885 [Candidatus Saccharibacteria bacterium]|nr:hypothetical protein [Candidatus Saccharibacteria bacterium]
MANTKKKPAKADAAKKATVKAPAVKKTTAKKPAVKKATAKKTESKRKMTPLVITLISVGGALVLGALAFVGFQIFKNVMRNGTYCAEKDGEVACIIVDGDNVDFGKNILKSRAITGKIGANGMISFSEDDRAAYREACKKSWFCYDKDLDDKKIVFGGNWITIDNVRLEKGDPAKKSSSDDSEDKSSSSTKISKIGDSGTGSGDSKIFDLPAGKYSIRYKLNIAWSDPDETSANAKLELRNCSSSSSYCSYEKTFYTNYLYRSKNETSTSKSETFEVKKDGSYKIEVSTYDDITIGDWDFTIESR